MTAEIIEFTGSTTGDIPPKKILKYAEDLVEVVVVGFQEDNSLYVAGSKASIAEVIYLLELAKRFLLNLSDEE